jgi:lysozyme
MENKMNLKPAIDLIKQFEGLKLEAYLCSAGVPTIGIGTTVYPNGVKVKIGETCSSAEAEAFFRHDLMKFSEELAPLLSGLPIVPNQHCALLSLCYNIGITNFKKSTLLKRLKQGDLEGAANQFLVWVKADGKVVKGLVNRREKERALFIS